jgi:hypothetical protein
MLVAEAPRKMAAKAPLVEGTEQWAVTVIDCSGSGHGPTDTRAGKGKDGKSAPGLGRGVFRLYADGAGKVAGFSWSTGAKSSFVAPRDEPLVIGRLKPGYRP